MTFSFLSRSTLSTLSFMHTDYPTLKTKKHSIQKFILLTLSGHFMTFPLITIQNVPSKTWELVLFVYPFFYIVPECQFWHPIFLLKFFFVASPELYNWGWINQIQVLQTRILNAMSKNIFHPSSKLILLCINTTLLILQPSKPFLSFLNVKL